MAYLKLVFDELEIAHLSEDGQYLCANKGVPQYRTDYLDFVCTDQEGKLIRPNFVTEHFDWLLTKYGLKHIRFHDLRHPYVKHTTKIFSLRLMDSQAQAYPDARRKTRGACQLHRGGQNRSSVRPLCNRKRFS